jgi:hypothetical protein
MKITHKLGVCLLVTAFLAGLSVVSTTAQLAVGQQRQGVTQAVGADPQLTCVPSTSAPCNVDCCIYA